MSTHVANICISHPPPGLTTAVDGGYHRAWVSQWKQDYSSQTTGNMGKRLFPLPKEKEWWVNHVMTWSTWYRITTILFMQKRKITTKNTNQQDVAIWIFLARGCLSTVFALLNRCKSLSLDLRNNEGTGSYGSLKATVNIYLLQQSVVFTPKQDAVTHYVEEDLEQCFKLRHRWAGMDCLIQNKQNKATRKKKNSVIITWSLSRNITHHNSYNAT